MNDIHKDFGGGIQVNGTEEGGYWIDYGATRGAEWVKDTLHLKTILREFTEMRVEIISKELSAMVKIKRFTAKL